MKWFATKEVKIPVKKDELQGIPENDEDIQMLRKPDYTLKCDLVFPENRSLSHEEIEYLRMREKEITTRQEKSDKTLISVLRWTGGTLLGLILGAIGLDVFEQSKQARVVE